MTRNEEPPTRTSDDDERGTTPAGCDEQSGRRSRPRNMSERSFTCDRGATTRNEENDERAVKVHEGSTREQQAT